MCRCNEIICRSTGNLNNQIPDSCKPFLSLGETFFSSSHYSTLNSVPHCLYQNFVPANNEHLKYTPLYQIIEKLVFSHLIPPSNRVCPFSFGKLLWTWYLELKFVCYNFTKVDNQWMGNCVKNQIWWMAGSLSHSQLSFCYQALSDKVCTYISPCNNDGYHESLRPREAKQPAG